MSRKGRHLEVFEGKDGSWFFRTVAGNGETTSTSESYTRYEDAVRGAVGDHPELHVYLQSEGGMEPVGDDTE